MDYKGTQKVQKLVTAIYLLTSFFDDKEPMKWRLRELGNGLVSQPNNPTAVSSIIGLLEVARGSGLISDMNYEIIHREFSSLLPKYLALEDILSKAESPQPSREKEARPTPSSTLYIASSIKESSQELSGEPREVKHTYLPDVKPEPRPEPKHELKEYGAVAVKKNSRQSVIVNLLKRKKEIMIKDVSPLIDGVSEKTIQRELLTMVKAGVLKKMGEKRWSRYSLAE